MDHLTGSGEEDVRRGCRRVRKPVLDKGTGKNGTSVDEAARGESEKVDDR